MAVTYVSVAECKRLTSDPTIRNLEQKKLEALIETAELFVDAHCGYWDKYDADQTRLFPRAIYDLQSDGSTAIPERVKHATIAQVEYMQQNHPDVEHGVEEDDNPSESTVSVRAKKLLRGYVNRTGSIQIVDKDRTRESYQ